MQNHQSQQGNDQSHTSISSKTTKPSTKQATLQRQHWKQAESEEKNQGNEENPIQAKANTLIVNPQSPYQTREGKLGPVKSKNGQEPSIQAKQRVVQAKQVSHKSKQTPLQLAKTVNKEQTAATETSTGNVTGLPKQLKAGVENLSGYAMDDVKVHYNSSKPTQMKAHAYAQGTDIHLAPGQEKHLPHEAWHTVQQKQNKVKPTGQISGQALNDDPQLEKEADVMGQKAVQAKFEDSPVDLKQSSTTHPVQQQQVIQRVPLTPEEITTANTYNQGRYNYTAPTNDEETSYQEIIRLLNNVAQNEALYNAANDATEVGDDFARLVNAAQEQLFPENANAHDGQLGPGTLRAVMAAPANDMASTEIGIGENDSFISENQVSAPYTSYSNDAIGDFRVTGGVMEPAGHGQKGSARAIFAEQYFITSNANSGQLASFDMAAAIRFNAGRTINNLGEVINNLHALVQDDTLHTAAVQENDQAGMAFARLVAAAQALLNPEEGSIDGMFGNGTQTALTERTTLLEGYATSGETAIASADAFVQELAPFTEAFESRETHVYTDSEGIETIGVGFNLERDDAEARIVAVGANYQNILNGTEGLNDNQINILFFEDLENIGVNGARNVVANFDQLPYLARIVLADMAYNLGQTGLSNFTNMINAFEEDEPDYHTAADEMVDSQWFTQVGRRGDHHVGTIRLLASSRQDPRAQTVPAGPHNLGFDYVIENDEDEQIIAWYGGLVTQSGLAGGYGNRITIETDVRYNYEGTDYIVYTAYGHNDENYVEVGEVVQAGDVIGEMGGTGTGGATVYGAHVDLRTWITVEGSRIDISPNELERQLRANSATETATTTEDTETTTTDTPNTTTEDTETTTTDTPTTTTEDTETTTTDTPNTTTEDTETTTTDTPTTTTEDTETTTTDTPNTTTEDTETTTDTPTTTTESNQGQEQTPEADVAVVTTTASRQGVVRASLGLYILANTDHAYTDREHRQTEVYLPNNANLSIIGESSNAHGNWYQVSYTSGGNVTTGYVPQQYIESNVDEGVVNASLGLFILANTDYAYTDRTNRQTVVLMPNSARFVILGTLTNTHGSWYQVSYNDGQTTSTGYIPQQYTTAATVQGQVNASRGLYILANTNYAYTDRDHRETVVLLSSNTTINILGETSNDQGSWYRVSYENGGTTHTGYVPQKYITRN